MSSIDQKQAVLHKMQDILSRLRPLVDEVVRTELAYRVPLDETEALKTSLNLQLEQMEANLNALGHSSRKHP
jgi:HAMP domain-containing protein